MFSCSQSLFISYCHVVLYCSPSHSVYPSILPLLSRVLASLDSWNFIISRNWPLYKDSLRTNVAYHCINLEEFRCRLAVILLLIRLMFLLVRGETKCLLLLYHNLSHGGSNNILEVEHLTHRVDTVLKIHGTVESAATVFQINPVKPR